jgi:membrane protein required for colicin V production
MNLLDIILGIILILSFVSGMKKGLFVTLASLIGLVLGIIGALYFSDFAAGYIYEWFNWSEQTVNIAARAVTFIAIVIIISWAGKFLTKMADFAFLGVFNKILGGVFNVLISAFIVSVLFMFFNYWNPTDYVIPEEKKDNSYLYHPVASLAPMVLPHLIEGVEDYNTSEEKE